MSNITIKEILNSEDLYNQTISVTGVLTRYKAQKKFVFGSISDGSEPINLQFIYTFNDTDDNNMFNDLHIGCSLTVTGIIVASPAKGQIVELMLHNHVVHNIIENPETYLYGSAMNKRMNNTLHEERLINLRQDVFGRFNDRTLQCILRVRSSMKMSLYQFFNERNFYQIDTPILTKSDCEGAGEMFNITTLDPLKNNVDYSDDFFACKANLTVSGQLEAEALCKSLQRVFTFGPTFRAENSNTSRHLSEFWMLEPEQVFTHPDIEVRFNMLMDLQEDMVKHVIDNIFKTNIEDMSYLNKFTDDNIQILKNVSEIKFQRVTYTRVIELLLEHHFPDIVWGMDLMSEHERYICEEVFKKPTFITHYPMKLKSFYMKIDDKSICQDSDIIIPGIANEDSDRTTCQAVDLIVPGIGELCGGSMREDNIDQLILQMNNRGMNIADLEWYINLRRDGYLSTGGFGLGFERLIRYITGTKSIRDVTAFSRYKHHI